MYFGTIKLHFYDDLNFLIKFFFKKQMSIQRKKLHIFITVAEKTHDLKNNVAVEDFPVDFFHERSQRNDILKQRLAEIEFNQ